MRATTPGTLCSWGVKSPGLLAEPLAAGTPAAPARPPAPPRRPPAGNLLAPYITACSADLLFSGYQRLKQRQVDAAQRQSMETIRALVSRRTPGMPRRAGAGRGASGWVGGVTSGSGSG